MGRYSLSRNLDEALRLYIERGEFDGKSAAQARRCLTGASYTWSGDVRKHVLAQIKQGTYTAMLARAIASGVFGMRGGNR